jgi:hypothetical protein
LVERSTIILRDIVDHTDLSFNCSEYDEDEVGKTPRPLDHLNSINRSCIKIQHSLRLPKNQPSTEHLTSHTKIHILSYHTITPSSFIPSLLLPTQRILHAPSNRAIRIEVLANRTFTRKRSADLLAEVADGAVLGESTADSSLCVESCRSLLVGGVLAAGGGCVSMIGMFGVLKVEDGRVERGRTRMPGWGCWCCSLLWFLGWFGWGLGNVLIVSVVLVQSSYIVCKYSIRARLNDNILRC